jgi:hypothetical protein
VPTPSVLWIRDFTISSPLTPSGGLTKCPWLPRRPALLVPFPCGFRPTREGFGSRTPRGQDPPPGYSKATRGNGFQVFCCVCNQLDGVSSMTLDTRRQSISGGGACTWTHGGCQSVDEGRARGHTPPVNQWLRDVHVVALGVHCTSFLVVDHAEDLSAGSSGSEGRAPATFGDFLEQYVQLEHVRYLRRHQRGGGGRWGAPRGPPPLRIREWHLNRKWDWLSHALLRLFLHHDHLPLLLLELRCPSGKVSLVPHLALP